MPPDETQNPTGATDPVEPDPTTLETETIDDVPLVIKGRHTDRKGRVFDANDQALDGLVDTFAPLTQRGWRVPVVLSHDLDPTDTGIENHVALGWLSHVRRAGDIVVGRLSKVPKQVAALYRAGAWGSLSPKILGGLQIGDYTAPFAFKHVSLCGARQAAQTGLKAFDSIAGLVQMYLDTEATPNTDLQYEFAAEFEIGDVAGATDPGATTQEVGMERTDALKALDLTEEGLAELTSKANAHDAVKADATKAAEERDALRTTIVAGKATAALERHKAKLKVPDRKRLVGTIHALARSRREDEGAIEFEFDAGEKPEPVKLDDPVTEFIALLDSVLPNAPDAVETREQGLQTHEEPGSGSDKPKPGSRQDVVEADNGETVEGTELDSAAEAKAKELLDADAKRPEQDRKYIGPNAEANAYQDALVDVMRGGDR